MFKKPLLLIITSFSLLFFSLAPLEIKAVPKSFKLSVFDTENVGKVKEIRKNIEKSRGQSVREEFTFNINDKIGDFSSSSDAYALNIKDLSTSEKNEVKELVETNKPVYLFGGLRKEEANELFGEEIFKVLEVR